MSAEKNETWKEFIGMMVDLDKLKAQGWYDQGSDNHHFGLPRKKMLWVKRFSPSSQCEMHTFFLFVFLQLGARQKIRSVHTAVHMVYNDGSYDDLGVEFFPEDLKKARRLIQSTIRKEPPPTVSSEKTNRKLRGDLSQQKKK